VLGVRFRGSFLSRLDAVRIAPDHEPLAAMSNEAGSSRFWIVLRMGDAGLLCGDAGLIDVDVGVIFEIIMPHFVALVAFREDANTSACCCK